MPIDKATPTDPHVNPDPQDGSYPTRPGLVPGTLIGDTIPVDRGQSEAHERDEVRVTHNAVDLDAEQAAQDELDEQTKAANAKAEADAEEQAKQDEEYKAKLAETEQGRAGTYVKDQYHDELVAGHGADVDITEDGEPVHDPGTDLYVYEEENAEAGTTTGTTGAGRGSKPQTESANPATGAKRTDADGKASDADTADDDDDDDDTEYVTLANTREELNEAAREAGVEAPESLGTKQDVLDAINEQG